MQHTNDGGADSSSPSEDDADETDNNTNDDAVIRGYLFKRHSRTVSMQEHWKSRYFVLLSDNTLEYYRSEDDAKPKDRFLLGPGCTISDLFVEKYKKKPLYCMRVHFERSVLDDSSHDGSAVSLQSTTGEPQHHHQTLLPKSPLRKFFRKPTAENNSTDPHHHQHPEHTFDDDADDAICAELRHAYYTQQQHQHKKTYHKLVQGTQLVAAAGAAVGVTAVTAFTGGLVAGAIALGVAGATGGGAVALRSGKKQQRDIHFVVASPEYRTMKRWRAVLLAAREALDHRNWWCDAKTARAALVPADDSSHHCGTTAAAQSPLQQPQLQKWTPVDGGWVVAGWAPGLRLTRSAAAWKASVVIETTALDAFVCCMSKQASAVLESMDAHTDIVRLVLRPLTLGITQTTPRDCVLYRYWRLEQDGTYVICYQSVEHAACPPSRDHVRAELHAVYTIAPPAKQRKGCGGGGGMLQQQQQQMNINCCLMTGTVQLDPKGWIPTLPLFHQQSYSDVFAVVALNTMLDMRDEIDRERFVDTAARKRTRPNDITSAPPGIARNQSTDTNDTAEVDGVNYDFAFASHESHHDGSASTTGFTLVPRPLSSTFWAEPDSNSFRVRGQTYKDDHLKVNAGRSIARLVAVDIVTVDEPIYTGFSMHPGERIQLALQKEKELKRTTKSDLPPFIFVVNIVLPGPPFYHMVYYYAIDDMSTIDGSDGTPSSQLCQQFFFGECDEFRDATFKLIPQIIDGHFLVRKAVGSTPAIMGKKLRQLYVRRKRWMEVILDCGSSPVATGVIRLSVGYAKTLVVDMGFVLQGDEPEVLPERIFGCARIKNIVMEGPHIRHVETMPPVA